MLSLSKDKIKIVLLEGVHQKAVDFFEEHGYQMIEYHRTALDDAALIEAVRDAHIIGIRSRTKLHAPIFEAAKKLITVGCFCIGTNQVDLRAAAAKGVPVFNAPHANTRSVAELVMGFMVMLFRRTFEKSCAAHRGEWLKVANGCYELRGKILGIVGYGHIGSQLSIMAEAMGMRVLYYDVCSKLPLGNARAVPDLETLLSSVDVLSLHVPEDASTKNLIDDKALSLMQEGSHLINTSRGTVVDLEALATHLKSKHLAGAAIDVYPVEPSSNNEAFHNVLQGLDQVILTPHIGGSTIEAQENIGIEVAEKLVYFSDRGSSEGACNFPPLSLKQQDKSHRILHIHHNIPGILQQINAIIAKTDTNIIGQSLLTDDKIGYVVLDVDKDSPKELLNALRDIKGTIRSRILY